MQIDVHILFFDISSAPHKTHLIVVFEPSSWILLYMHVFRSQKNSENSKYLSNYLSTCMLELVFRAHVMSCNQNKVDTKTIHTD